jgi:FMN-dependent oxidoreductase (nitrilotriacetate monooxygenase family)
LREEESILMSGQRELHLNAFLMEAGHHEAAWRLPESNPRADFDLAHWIALAQLAEAAKFDSLFLADGPALTGDGEFRPPGQLEPLTLLTALAQHTSRIGLIATVSSTYNEPYNLARRLASVDHVSGGRAGWNIVTSAGADEAANFGLDDRPDHAVRYVRANEFLNVAKALWDSWESEAVLADKVSGRYADPKRLHAIRHAGSHFKVAGALNVERPPQGYPLLVQAGSSEDGKDFAARHAEAIFTAHQTYERAADFYGDIKARTRAAGRNPDSVLVLPGIVPFIGSTEAEAQELAKTFDDLRVPEYGLWQLANIFETDTSAFELDEPLPDSILARPKLQGTQSRSDLIIEMAQREDLTVREVLSRLGGGRGHFTFVGTPEQIADTIIAWFEGGAADGFNIMAPALPSSLGTFIEHVLPILRGKALFREDYRGTTLRDHYGLPIPANQFQTDDAHSAV